jgi:signal transduction histidine kinase
LRPMAGSVPSRSRPLWASVRTRTTAAAVVVVAVALLIAGAGLVVGLRTLLVRETRAAVMVRSADILGALEAGGDPVTDLAADDDVVLQVLDRSGRVISATPNVAGQPVLADLAPGESREVAVPFDDEHFLVIAAAASGGRMVLLGQSLEPVGESTSAVAGLVAIGFPVLLLVVGATTWRVTGRALAPVEAIRAEVDAISTRRLHRRVPEPSGEDEIGRLARTMNRMLDRLEQASLRQRHFVADASHELRTPIATIRQHAEVALSHPDLSATGELAGAVLAESLRMQGIVDDLLLLARADEGMLRPLQQPIDLDDLVLAEADRLRGAGVAVTIGGIAAARVVGDPAAVARVLRNLGDNAARHAKHIVAFGLSTEDGSALIFVDDDGTGIPTGDRDRVFDRFVRLDNARSRIGGGAGLGLAIVAEIVALHGGTVVVLDSPLGGARLAARLPLAQAEG